MSQVQGTLDQLADEAAAKCDPADLEEWKLGLTTECTDDTAKAGEQLIQSNPSSCCSDLWPLWSVTVLPFGPAPSWPSTPIASTSSRSGSPDLVELPAATSPGRGTARPLVRRRAGRVPPVRPVRLRPRPRHLPGRTPPAQGHLRRVRPRPRSRAAHPAHRRTERGRSSTSSSRPSST